MSYLTEINCQTVLTAIKEEKQKQKTLIESQSQSKQESDEFVEINPEENTFWTGLFANCFLCTNDESVKNSLTNDDLLFFVSKIETEENKIEVFRRDSKKLPCLTDFNYDWEETVYLNLILHEFEYTLTCAICIQTDKDLEILKRHSKRVYASPSKRDLESKGTEESITYPFIYFTVDDFDDAFNDMVVKEGEMVCVELVANDGRIRKVLFLGSIKHEALKKVYDARASTGSKLAERMNLGSFGKKRVEFIKMKGPGGKGYAQMAVSQYQKQNVAASVPATPLGDFDSFQSFFKFPANLRKKPSAYPSMPGTAVPSAAATPVIESRDLQNDLNSNAGYASFWNKTFSQFTLFNKKQGDDDRSINPNEMPLSQRSNSIAESSASSSNSTPIGTLLNSYLTYVTLNLQSIMKDFQVYSSGYPLDTRPGMILSNPNNWLTPP